MAMAWDLLDMRRGEGLTHGGGRSILCARHRPGGYFADEASPCASEPARNARFRHEKKPPRGGFGSAWGGVVDRRPKEALVEPGGIETADLLRMPIQSDSPKLSYGPTLDPRLGDRGTVRGGEVDFDLPGNGSACFIGSRRDVQPSSSSSIVAVDQVGRRRRRLPLPRPGTCPRRPRRLSTSSFLAFRPFSLVAFSALPRGRRARRRPLSTTSSIFLLDRLDKGTTRPPLVPTASKARARVGDAGIGGDDEESRSRSFRTCARSRGQVRLVPSSGLATMETFVWVGEFGGTGAASASAASCQRKTRTA